MKNLEQATSLAETMKKIGELANKETVCVITAMEEPLGEAVGNSLEVIEAINFLKGQMNDDVKEVVLTLGAYMIKLAGNGENIEENKQKMLEKIKNGEALNKLKQLVENQGGDVKYIQNTGLFDKAKYILEVNAEESGYIEKLDARRVGEISMGLGAGRIKKEDKIDATVGITLKKKIGDKVEVGDVLAYIYANDELKVKEAAKNLIECYKITNKKVEKSSSILKII